MAKSTERPGMYVSHERVPYFDPEPISLTRQEFADECDVNALMARYDKAGVWPPQAPGQPAYFDCTIMPATLQDALQVMRDAETAFMSLPASVRREFDNDAMTFVEFAQDPENLPQMRDWGLAEPLPKAEAPTRVEIVNPLKPADPPAPIQ